MLQVIDPSVTDEADPFSVDPALDMYDPDNGWRPWPEPSLVRPGLAGPLPGGAARPGRPHRRGRPRRARRPRHGPRSAHLGRSGQPRGQPPPPSGGPRPLPHDLPDAGRPAHLDPTIDPDDRALGSIFAFPDPLDANYGYGGLARTMTARGWLSTWSGLSSHGDLADLAGLGPDPDAGRPPDRRHRDPPAPGRAVARSLRRGGPHLRRAAWRAALPARSPPGGVRPRRRLDPHPPALMRRVHRLSGILAWTAVVLIALGVVIALIPVRTPGVQDCGMPIDFLIGGDFDRLPDASGRIERDGRVVKLDPAARERASRAPVQRAGGAPGNPRRHPRRSWLFDGTDRDDPRHGQGVAPRHVPLPRRHRRVRQRRQS